MVRTRFFGRRTLRVAVLSLALCGVLAGIAMFAGSTATAATCTATGGPPISCSNPLNGSVTITGGALTLTASDLAWGAGITLNGLDLDKVAVGAGDDHFEVDDLTGSAAGWHVTALPGRFCTDYPTCANTGTDHALATTALTFNGNTTYYNDTAKPAATCIGTATCSAPANGAAGPFPLVLTSGGTAQTLFSAAAGTGMGSYDIASVWWLHLPANTAAGTYTSTVTLALSSTP
jgi:hypothetical protein